MKSAFCILLSALAGACAAPVQHHAIHAAPPSRFQPCALEAGPLELPVGEEFALAASEGACLLIDESQEATFISIAEIRDDEEGSALLQADVRAFLRTSGLLGDAPRFTGRDHALILGQDVEVHTFVATPAGLMTRAGFALSAQVHGGAVLFVGFDETPEGAAALRSILSGARMR